MIDAPPDSDGSVTFSAVYDLTQGSVGTAAVWVQALPGDRAALERFFAEHRSAHCAGMIIRAPCPPGTHVSVDVPSPPVGRLIRQP